MTGKRRLHGDDESSQNGTKRARSTSGSPAPKVNGAAAGTAVKTDIQKQLAEARARAEAVKARLATQKSGTDSASAANVSTQTAVEAARAKIEAMRARVAAATKKPAETVHQSTFASAQLDDGFSRARGGLGIGLHPTLMNDTSHEKFGKGKQAGQSRNGAAYFSAGSRDSFKSAFSKGAKKQLDLSGPDVEELKKTLLYDPDLGTRGSSQQRHSRQLVFHQKGKFIQQANALRRQAALEAMKKRIAEQARKVGLDEDNEKAYSVPEPPDVEWWDEGLIENNIYDRTGYKIDTPDSIITLYIQHPVLLEPPQDKNAPPPKPMYLTKKEMAKLRRQRRMADHKEQQAKIRLGLEPPPPPKVKKSNLMRVLGEQAVKDPTAVEARVNREIADRKAAHLASNDDRKLSKEERAQKIAANQEADVARGVRIAVFKIGSLAHGKHRYQVDINAKESGLTGICILNPRFCLIIVEGGAKSIEFYKKLMLQRIKWSEIAAPSTVNDDPTKTPDPQWLQPANESGELKDFLDNRCVLVWEGEEKNRNFRKWGSKVCETDGEAKEVLTRAKMENFWTLAKSTG